MQRTDELRHLRSGPGPDERPGGVGLVRVAVAADDAVAVLDRVRQVLVAVLEAPDQAPTSAGRQARLPGWFLDGCAEAEEAEEAVEARTWTVAGWLSWFEPDERQWWWWAAEVEDERHLAVQIQLDGWPCPFGALVRLLRVAGATSIEVED